MNTRGGAVGAAARSPQQNRILPQDCTSYTPEIPLIADLLFGEKGCGAPAAAPAASPLRPSTGSFTVPGMFTSPRSVV